MAEEAYVKISEVLKDAPASSSVNSEFLATSVIKARCGDFEPTYLTDPKQLLDKYTPDGQLSATEDVSLINAFELLPYMPLLVVRSGKKEYKPKRLGLNTRVFTGQFNEVFGGKQSIFDIEFTDFMKDKRFQVKYDIREYPLIPGSVKLDVTYERKSSLFKYTPGALTVDEGTVIQLGDIIELKSTDSKVKLSAKVFDVDEAGKPTDVRLLTDVGEEDVNSVTGSGVTIPLTSAAMPNEVIKSYSVIFGVGESTVDDKGNSIYYKNVWNPEWPFKVTDITGTPREVTIPNPYKVNDPTQPDTLTYYSFGPFEAQSGVLDSTIETDSLADVYDPVDNQSLAWSKLTNYESMDIPIFTDLGTPNIGKSLRSQANVHNAMYLVSLPRLSESVTMAKVWGDLDLGNSRRYACTPFAVTTHLGFTTYIAPTTQYLKTLVNNRDSGNEFEAVAGANTGVVSFSNLTKNYDKKERKQLLDLKINTITYRESQGYAMFNDDLTGLMKNNPFKEEFNRRIGVAVNQGVSKLMTQFYFQLNTPSLRDTIETTVTSFIKLSSFIDKIADFQVICDDSINPPSLQAQNKVAIKVNIAFYYSAKYFEVVNTIYSVGQSFTS